MEKYKEICEFCDCENIADTYNEDLEAFLCEDHEEGCGNSTGYCNRSCQLGYGCDGSC